MLLPRAVWVPIIATATLAAAAFAFQQQPFRVYESLEPHDFVPLPPDYQQPAEWVFGRLMFAPHPYAQFGRRSRWGGRPDWRRGETSWTQDYPRADRTFAMALRRLTRLNTRSVEQPVNLEDRDDVFYWPFLFAGEMGDWLLDDAQAAKLREYLLRGGFLLLDDFWNPAEWARFMESMEKVFPDRAVVDVPETDPVVRTVFTIEKRLVIPGRWGLTEMSLTRRCGNPCDAMWRGIYDDRGRLMVLMFFNSDVGDAWEWADSPWYPEPFAALGIRIGVNAVIYSMTH